MVKGVSKRVIVVRSPDVRYFEQAIFIVKDDALAQNGVTAERILEEACRVANGYIRSTSKSLLQRIPAPVFFGLGVFLTAALWLGSILIF